MVTGVNLSVVARRFKIPSTKAIYDDVLAHSNANTLRMLATQDTLFQEAYDDILASEEDLFSNIIIPGDIVTVVPINKGACVYFLFQDETLVYIGKSVHVLARIAAHEDCSRKQFNGVYVCPVDESVLSDAEMINIFYYQPEYNKDSWNHRQVFRTVLRKIVGPGEIA
jgi:hypothetical protein